MAKMGVLGIALVLLLLGSLASWTGVLFSKEAAQTRSEAMGTLGGWVSTEWNRTYGGFSSEFAYALVQTSDGGYALVGYTYSYGAGGSDFWLVKTDWNGNALWNKTYGGTNDDKAYALVQTSDGGYALAGYTLLSSNGSADFWLVRTDWNGNALWNKTYGGINDDVAYALVRTADGGYALAGYTISYGAGGSDFWLVRTDASGNALWNKTYGGINDDKAYALVQTADGGYALAGYTISYGAGGSDFWLVRTDASGNALWNKTYGGINVEYAYSMVQTVDGGYALAGSTISYGAGGSDFWLVRTDWNGNALWNKTYGGTNYEEAHALEQTVDGGYVLAGYTGFPGPGPGGDFWLVRTDWNGNALWNKTYGGTNDDKAYALVQTSDGGYALAGDTSSYGAGTSDFWLVKFAPGIIYINPDGSVDPPTGLIQRDGNLYTFTDNIYTSADVGIMIGKDDITLDGAGYVLNGGGTGLTGIQLSGVTNVTVQNVNIHAFSLGIYVEGLSRNIIVDNNVTYCPYGIELLSSSDNTVARNHVTDSIWYGILLCQGEGEEGSPSNTLFSNTLINNYVGISLSQSSNNSLSENTVVASNDTAIYIESSSASMLMSNNITNNSQGIRFSSCSDNHVYHNNFMNNGGSQVQMSESTATWDEGYPSGGNYWSDYNGTDVYRGPGQNETGSDGIGDTPYVINEYTQDNYPLMQPWTGSHSTQYPWPMFRHDLTHAGHTESSGPNTNQTLWSYATDSYPDSSPTVADGKVYVGSVDGRVYCLDSLTGTQIWNYTTGGWVFSSPAVDDGRVYVGSDDNRTYCLDASTGVQLWNCTTGYWVDSSPAVVGGVVYVGSWDGNVYALNAATGTKIWNCTTGYWVESSPAVVGGVVYIGSYDGNVYALNAPTGTKVWNYTTGGRVLSSPSVADGVVYVGSRDNAIYALNAATGTKIWNYTTGSHVFSSPAVAGNVVYVGSADDNVYALNAATGTKVWSYTTGDSVDSSPTVADGRVYVGSSDAHVYAFGRVISFPQDYPTLQTAINAASPGDTIIVAPGVYHDQSVVVNKTITIIGEQGSDPIFDGGGSGQIFMSLSPGASGTVIAGLVITNYGQGIVVNASNCKIYNTQMSLMSQNGIALMGAGTVNNQIYGNIFQNNQIAVNLTASSTGNTVHDNIVSTNVNVGIDLESSGNIVCTNTISGNHMGIRVAASGNTIYHNNIISNIVQTGIQASTVNTWDNGYPSGGNYWSDYATKYPNAVQVGGSGIWNTPYTLDANNKDNYPLINPWGTPVSPPRSSVIGGGRPSYVC